MTRWLVCLMLSLSVTKAVAAQTNSRPNLPIRATVCQLENHPSRYDRKLVETQGRVYFDKFDFIIDAHCEPHGRGRVWLDFGGDIVSPSEYWNISNFLPKQKGVNVQVQGIAIPAARDHLMDKFVNDIGATRFRKPDGAPCGPECQFYEVSATVTGMFFSGARGGFGMEQCCHLLVIEKVAAVSSKRTSVPAGGEYECTLDRWHPTPQELKALSSVPGCSLAADSQNCYPAIAQHWGDSINPNVRLHYSGPWTSPDMTRLYGVNGRLISKAGPRDSAGNPRWKTEILQPVTISREVCRPTVPPKPSSDHVTCKFYRSSTPENRESAMASQKLLDSAKEHWRASDMEKIGWQAYENAAMRWKLTAPSQIKLEKCQPWPPFKDGQGNERQAGYCTWVAKNDMEEITVQMYKPGYPERSSTDLQNVTWIPYGVEINLCRTDSVPH